MKFLLALFLASNAQAMDIERTAGSSSVSNFSIDSDKIATGAIQTEKIHSEALNDTTKVGGFASVNTRSDISIRNTTPKLNLLDASGSLVGYLAYESGGTATVLRGVADDVGITDPAGNRLLTLKSNGGLVLLAGTTIYGNVGTVSLTTAAYNTSVSSTPNIFIDNSGRVGIRNGKPTQSLSIDNYGATPIVYVRRGNGAVTAPTAIVSGNVFGAFEAGGFDGTSYGTKNTIMQSDAMENWSTTAKGSRTSFSVTTVGTTNLLTAMSITSPVAGEGYVGFGTSLPSTRIHASSGVVTIDGNSSGLNVGEGTTVVRIKKTASGSIDLGGSITANCTAETNVSISGVAAGDSCTVNTPAALASTDWVVCRTLTDNVALKYCTQGSAVDPAAMVYTITTIEY